MDGSTPPPAKAPDCPVDRTPHGHPCEGPGTYYCDETLWGSDCRRWQARNGGYHAPDEVEHLDPTPAEQLARRFHEAYERLAPGYSYSTRKDSAVPWERVPIRNRRLMVAVAQELLDGGL
jgi:hypothetical protein